MRIIFYLFSLILIFSANVFAADSSVFEDLRSRYMSLRNRDSKGILVEEWRDIVDALTDYTSRDVKDFDHESALFFLGVASGKVYGASRDKSYYLRARRAFFRVSKEFKGGDRGDDALLALGDLLRENGDIEASVIAYERLIKDFPSSELKAVAEQRLKGAGSERSHELEAKPLKTSLPVVIIDPGHGGEDFGAVGLGNLLEKDVALDIALLLQSEVEKRGVALAELTRRVDSFVPLADRAERINKESASLLVSIHANASPKDDLFGVETYYLDVAASDEASKKVSERENASGESLIGASEDVEMILNDLIRRAKQPDSKKLAETIHASLLGTLKRSKEETKDLGVKKAPFFILASVNVPSALLEVGFLDHEDEGLKLADRSFRRKVAEGIADGIQKFLNSRGR